MSTFLNYIKEINLFSESEPKAFGLRCNTSRNDKSLPFDLSNQNGQTKFAERSEITTSFDSVEHSNEFSIKSEDNGPNSNSNPKPKSKVKFIDQSQSQSQSHSKSQSDNNKKINKKDKTILNYYDSIKINFLNTYGSTNIATTFLTILFMTLKIIYKNLTNK